MLSKEAATASYAASISGLGIGNWFHENWLSLISTMFMVATFVVQVYYSQREDKRRNESHQRRMREIDDDE